MTDILREAAKYQRKLFEILDEFFLQATGKTATNFSSIRGFSEAIRVEPARLAARAFPAYSKLHDELRALYGSRGLDTFRAAKQIAGLKLVQAGTRFTESHLKSLQTSLLYADTVLIPDPVYPWIESDRREERFRDVLLLQNAHALLHLKPLIDAELPNLPILVFPSFEKALEERDQHTQQGIRQLTADVIARFVDPGVQDFAQASDFVRRNPDQFVEAVERFSLVVAPGGPIGNSAAQSLAQYEEEIRTWRTPEWISQFSDLSPAIKLMYLLTERLAPQFHLLENSEELRAHPLVAIEQQAHYFKIVSDTNGERLTKIGLLSGNTSTLIGTLKSERFGWLSNVPIDALVEIRSNNENIGFRKRLENAVARLHESTLEDVDKVAAEVCLEIDHAIAEHQKLIREIDSKYSQKNIKTAGAAIAVAACALVPSLAPFLGPALPFAVATKFGWDAWDRRIEKRTHAKSLLGVLFSARNKDS
jgi:hypothetical protein